MECVEGPSRKWAARCSSGTQLGSPWSEVSSAGDGNKRLHLVTFRFKGRPESLFSDLKMDISVVSDTSTVEVLLGTE